jgi:CheY-like chemotaxis protein
VYVDAGSGTPIRLMSRVLIVEDEPDVRRMLELLLKHEGYEVTTAANGAEALAAMRQEMPCLVLLDIMMPVMDGWQFRRHQLANADIANVPVLCLTAVFDPNVVARELKIRCLPKPVGFEQLLEEVAAACG